MIHNLTQQLQKTAAAVTSVKLL